MIKNYLDKLPDDIFRYINSFISPLNSIINMKFLYNKLMVTEYEHSKFRCEDEYLHYINFKNKMSDRGILPSIYKLFTKILNKLNYNINTISNNECQDVFKLFNENSSLGYSNELVNEFYDKELYSETSTNFS